MNIGRNPKNDKWCFAIFFLSTAVCELIKKIILKTVHECMQAKLQWRLMFCSGEQCFSARCWLMHAVGIKSATHHRCKNTAETVCLGFWENENQVLLPEIFICLLIKRKKMYFSELKLDWRSTLGGAWWYKQHRSCLRLFRASWWQRRMHSQFLFPVHHLTWEKHRGNTRTYTVLQRERDYALSKSNFHKLQRSGCWTKRIVGQTV